MKRSAKIGIAIAFVLVAILLGTVAIGFYLVVEHYRGIQFIYAGHSAVERGDYEAAGAKYDAAIHCRLDNRNLAIAYCGRGIACERKKQFDRAIQDLNESIRRFPFFSQAFVYRGDAFESKGDLNRAVADYSKAIDLDPNQAYSLLHRGEILLKRGQIEDALRDFDEAVRADPMNAQPLVERGLAYERKNYLASALASFESALRMDPNNRTAQFYREKIISGRTNEEFARLTSRNQSFHNFQSGADGEKLPVEDLPPSEWSHDLTEQRIAYDLLQRGLAALESKNYGEAIKIFTEALAHHPTFDNQRAILCDRGNSYDRLNMKAKAVEDYDRAIKLDPKFVEAYYNRGLSERDLRQFDKAMSDFSEAVRLDPQFARAYVTRAALFVRRGSIAKAAKDYRAASRTVDSIEPGHRHVLLNDLAWMRATSSREVLRNGREAVAQATKACDLTGWSNSDYIDTLAAAFAEVGNFKAAIDYQAWVLGGFEVAKGDREGMQKRLELYRRHTPYRTKPKR